LHSGLEKYTHVFLHQDTRCRGLEPPYSGTHQVLSRREKTLHLLVCGRPVTLSANKVKPAYILNRTDRGSNFNSPATATPAIAPPATPPQTSIRTTRSGCQIHFPSHFNI
jgi:hypothetical protein